MSELSPKRHSVWIGGGGAMCRDCDWFYSPGCGHNAETHAHRAAFQHEQGIEDPFCASSPAAAAMSDAEFWEHVYPQPEPPDIDDNEPDEFDRYPEQCPECGSFTACGYDAEGRPLIHAITEDDA